MNGLLQIPGLVPGQVISLRVTGSTTFLGTSLGGSGGGGGGGGAPQDVVL